MDAKCEAHPIVLLGFPLRYNKPNMDRVRAEAMAKRLIGTVVDGWLIRDFVNHGKSAVVFRGERAGQTAAVKVFDPELVARFGKDHQLRRIGREKALLGLHHQNLIEIFDGGECSSTGLLYIAMAFTDAPNLATVLSDAPRERIWPLIEQVAAAAQFLEQRSLAHRDIKPDNIAITTDFRQAILLDLGVIRPIGDPTLTDEDYPLFVGTLQYSSPEFLFRDEDDTAPGWRGVTFYQLGAVLHDMLMKKRLFAESAHPFARLVEAIRHDKPDIRAEDVPQELVFLASNCLVKDPALRLQLVTWSDFAVAKSDGASAFAAKERIRKRLLIAQSTGLSISLREEDREARETLRVLDHIQSQVQATAKEECIASGLFPPVELHESASSSLDTSHFRLYIRPSSSFGLTVGVSVWFDVTLLHCAAQVISVSCRTGIGPTPIDFPTDHAPVIAIFEGVFNDVVLRKRINDMLYLILDYVQGNQNVDGSATQFIDIRLPGNS